MQPVPVGRITETLRRRENDLVWRVRRKGRKGRAGEWLYVYVMLELQSTVDPRMAVRIMAYMGLFYDDLTRSLNWKPSQKLPPVVAVVLYNGPKPWRAKLDIAELIESVGPALAPYIPKVVYKLVDIWRCPVLGGLNLADLTFRLDRSEGPAEAEGSLGDLNTALRGPGSGSMRRMFVGFVREWLAARLPGVDVKGVKTLGEAQTMVGKGKLVWSEKWFDQGLKKGRQEGQLEFLLRLVQRRFGDAVADTVRAAVAAMRDPSALDELGDWLLDCDTADAFLARLKRA